MFLCFLSLCFLDLVSIRSVSFTSTVQIQRWRRLRAEGTRRVGAGGPDAGHHAAGQGNQPLTPPVYTADSSHYRVYEQFLNTRLHRCKCMSFNMTSAPSCPQLAMRGPTGPMGLTGRPGPLVRVSTRLEQPG